jgi:tetratricopeptide (TPR) repeat protein
VFRLANKTMESGMHRTIDRKPKGRGWVSCAAGIDGMMCKPDKAKEAIELFTIAYEVLPDIAALNQVAIAYELLGDTQEASEYFGRMKTQAERENDEVYGQVAQAGLARC